MIDGKNFFARPVENDKIPYENIRKIATGRRDDNATGCLLDYAYFRDNYKMIAIDLSNQQALDADPIAIEQINFTANFKYNTRILFILQEAKKTVLDI